MCPTTHGTWCGPMFSVSLLAFPQLTARHPCAPVGVGWGEGLHSILCRASLPCQPPPRLPRAPGSELGWVGTAAP